ncbi:hypothetical protein [Deinococcus yavapaiensis]|uniref:Uncharacterized protein n=1 Tax=Deinococcus yavapaiensis KR-236 TaxID=694435 RepID=A0A318SC63_9DEIO|nr:hypothetical protein [Deinococcus yavapaiensis]PYE48691.1 hypothetical protein DES52_12725 [Deinococcus yavapaiensis KR-236]
MQRFGEAPAYSTRAAFQASLACLAASLPQGALSVFALDVKGVGAWFLLIFTVGLFLLGTLLLVRYFEARDGMTDLAPRTRLYDVRHERVAYLLGIVVTSASVLLDAWFALTVRWGWWHLLPLALAAWGTTLFVRLLTRRAG